MFRRAVQLKNREEYVLDVTDIPIAEIRHIPLGVTDFRTRRDGSRMPPRHNCEELLSFFISRTIVRAKNADYKCYLQKM